MVGWGQRHLLFRRLGQRELDERAIYQFAFPEGIYTAFRLFVVGFELKHLWSI